MRYNLPENNSIMKCYYFKYYYYYWPLVMLQRWLKRHYINTIYYSVSYSDSRLYFQHSMVPIFTLIFIYSIIFKLRAYSFNKFNLALYYFNYCWLTFNLKTCLKCLMSFILFWAAMSNSLFKNINYIYYRKIMLITSKKI